MKRSLYFIHKTGQTQRGAAAVEFSILIIPLLLMLLGVTEYGRAIYQYNTLTKSVRDATRYLSGLSSDEIYRKEARNIAVCGYTDCTNKNPLAPGLEIEMVHVCDANVCSATHHTGSINLVTVTINHASLSEKFSFNSLFNFSLFGLTFGAPDITFGPIQNTMRQI